MILSLDTVLSRDKNSSFKTPESKQTSELAGIEILRFLCAIAVLVWHYQHLFFVGEFNNDQALSFRSAQPFYELLQYAYEGGFWAVQVFWGISGFIFYWTYAQPISDRRVGLLEFAMRRFSRLYPLHITTLMLVALLQYVYFGLHGQYFIYQNNGVHAFASHLLFASNWFQGQTLSFNGPIWSVSVEILIYFTFFAVMWMAGPSALTAVFVCLASWALNHFKYFFPLDSNVFSCALFFFAGGFTLWLSRQRLALPLCLCAGALTITLSASGILHVGFASVILILTVCFLVVFARLGELKAATIMRRLAFLGNATYSSYLVHFPIQLGIVIAVDAMGYSRTIFLAPVTFAIYLASIIAISLAVHRLFELPAQKWIRGLAGRLRRPQGSLAKI